MRNFLTPWLSGHSELQDVKTDDSKFGQRQEFRILEVWNCWDRDLR